MRRAEASGTVPVPPAEALELWCDQARWEAFVDGFARTLEVGDRWPEPGSELVWESTPDGRGRVRSRVEHYESPPPGPDVAMQSAPGRLVTRVKDDSLEGTETASFAPAPEGTRVELRLEYELTSGGALRGLTDLLFIRRALRDSLRRTVARFAAEAGSEL